MRVPASPFNLDRLQREVNILLISDLHYDVEREKGKKPWMQGPVVNDAMVASLETAGEHWEPDILIVAGDLVNHNKPKNYPHYIDLIKKLTARFPNLRHTYFSTPGNHDINRENMVSVFPYLYTLRQKSPDSKMESSFTGNPVVDNIFTIAKESIDDYPELIEALGNFEKEYFKTYLAQKAELHKDTLYPIKVEHILDGIQTVYHKSVLGITLVSLNSSFFCNLSQTGQDRNNLFLIRGLIDKVKNKFRNHSYPLVTFMHHPYYYLHESEHIAPASWSTDKQNNFTKLVDISDLILSGHVHGDLQDPTYLQHHAYMITNGTSYTTDTFEDKCYPYTYALIKINKLLGKFNIKKFKYQEGKDPATGAASFAFRCVNNDAARFYNFFDRKHNDTTSLETEKVRVLRYFKDCHPERADVGKDCSYHIYQLRLFDKALEYPEFNYTLNCNVLADPECRLHEIVYGDKTIWIYVMDNMTYLPDIKKILSKRARDLPQGGMVYFSIAMEKLYENDAHDRKSIELLRKSYQALVLGQKLENVSLALLYH